MAFLRLFENPDTLVFNGNWHSYSSTRGTWSGAWANNLKGFLLQKDVARNVGHSKLFDSYIEYIEETRKMQDTHLVEIKRWGNTYWVGNVSKLCYTYMTPEKIAVWHDSLDSRQAPTLPPCIQLEGVIPVETFLDDLRIVYSSVSKLRIWSEQKVCSFWSEFKPEIVMPTLKLFKMAGIDPSDYVFENRMDAKISYPEFIGDQEVEADGPELPAEVKAEILKLKIQMHTANPEQRVVLQNKIDSLYKSAGVDVKKDMSFGSGKFDKRATSAGYGSAAQYRAARTTSENVERKYLNNY